MALKKTMELRLKGDFIELDNALKVLKVADDGVMAKELILRGVVRVNGAVEMRVRRKLKAGDRVETEDTVITVVSQETQS